MFIFIGALPRTGLAGRCVTIERDERGDLF